MSPEGHVLEHEGVAQPSGLAVGLVHTVAVDHPRSSESSPTETSVLQHPETDGVGSFVMTVAKAHGCSPRCGRRPKTRERPTPASPSPEPQRSPAIEPQGHSPHSGRSALEKGGEARSAGTPAPSRGSLQLLQGSCAGLLQSRRPRPIPCMLRAKCCSAAPLGTGVSAGARSTSQRTPVGGDRPRTPVITRSG